ncbi:MAG: hypothetical protein H7Y02_07015 [Candidatus Obscuribacterales bacterium]|nr:hypothetical protein [Steroidobacteraceae bacterium]
MSTIFWVDQNGDLHREARQGHIDGDFELILAACFNLYFDKRFDLLTRDRQYR